MDEVVRCNLIHIRHKLPAKVMIGVVYKRIYATQSWRNLSMFAKKMQDLSPHIDYTLMETMEDAVCARLLGLKGRLLLMYHCEPCEAALADKYDIELVVPNWYWIKKARPYIKGQLKVHLWFDSGLGKEGFIHAADVIDLASRVKKEPRFVLVGLGTKFNVRKKPSKRALDYVDSHKAVSELLDKQRQVFDQLVNDLRGKKLLDSSAVVHAACSFEVASGYHESYYDMVRLGNLAMYGYDFKPHIDHKTMVLDMKNVPAGWCFGYHCQHGTPKKDVPVALVQRTMSDGAIYSYKGTSMPVIYWSNPVVLDASGIKGIKVGDTIDVRYRFV